MRWEAGMQASGKPLLPMKERYSGHSWEGYRYRLGEYQEVFDKIVPRYLGMGLALMVRLLERRLLR
jgi:hypothetical protein